jgi:SAM-dependent methyltransferase
MLAREGFDAYGCDISENAVNIGRKILEEWRVDASLAVCSMTSTPYANEFFDTVVDVFSSYCLCRKDYILFLMEVFRILKPFGKFFSYFPSKNSDTFKRSVSSEKYDEDTLNGNRDKWSPYYGNDYFFRFMSQCDVKNLLDEAGFQLQYLESCGRTYRLGKEYFEWIVFEAVKT